MFYMNCMYLGINVYVYKRTKFLHDPVCTIDIRVCTMFLLLCCSLFSIPVQAFFQTPSDASLLPLSPLRDKHRG